MENQKPLSSEHRHDVALGIILSLITCGIYNIYWNSLQFKTMNALLGREEYNFWKWLLLTLITCGIFHVYYEYKMGSDLQAWLKDHGLEVSPNLALIGLGLSIFGLTVVADAVYQHEINRLAQ